MKKHSHAQVIDEATIPQADAIPDAALVDEPCAFVQGDGGAIFRTHEKLYLARTRMRASPSKQRLKQRSAVALVPMAEMDAHVEPENVRHLAKTHGPKTCVTDDGASVLGDKNLRRASNVNSDALAKSGLKQLFRFRNEQAIVLANNVSLSLTKSRSVRRQCVANGGWHTEWC